MKTVLYLLRHGATEANLAEPYRLQGRKHNPPLARLGIRQAEATRDFLAIRPIDHCYCSPLLRAFQTASIIAAPHGMSPQSVEGLTECDVGRWEGLDWQAIRYLDAEAYWRFQSDPAANGYPAGESFQQVFERAFPALEALLVKHEGQSILVVAHHIVNRTCLAHLLGLPISRAKQVSLDNCGISIIVRDESGMKVTTLNATFHLQGINSIAA
jgi:broad specificity phosphatase PhoE